MTNEQVRSQLQEFADDIRTLETKIEVLEGIEGFLQTEIKRQEHELLISRSSLADTQALLRLHKDKRIRDGQNIISKISEKIYGNERDCAAVEANRHY